MRIILYLGKGGVGKTTTAAASAIRSAELGYRTLVVSTDIAHSLADSLDVPLTGQPLEIVPNLFAQEINVLEEVREHWGQLQGYLGSALRKQGMSKAVAEEMAIIPGMEEVVSLLHINKQANDGHFDRVIVDAAPTGETIRLLTVPESFQWYVGRLRGWGDAPMRMAINVVSRFLPDKDLLGGLDTLVAGVKELQKVLTDPSITSYRVVLNPEKMVLKEGARAVTYLSLFGYPVDAAVVNRILPGIESDGMGNTWITEASADPYLHHLQQIQARYLGEIERDFLPAADSALALVRQGDGGRTEPAGTGGEPVWRSRSGRHLFYRPGADRRGRRRRFRIEAAAATGRAGQGTLDKTRRRVVCQHRQLQA